MKDERTVTIELLRILSPNLGVYVCYQILPSFLHHYKLPRVFRRKHSLLNVTYVGTAIPFLHGCVALFIMDFNVVTKCVTGS